jgi:hypothetical protein
VDISGQGARRCGVLVEEWHREAAGGPRSMSSPLSVLVKCEGEGILYSYICIWRSPATPFGTVVTAWPYRVDRVISLSEARHGAPHTPTGHSGTTSLSLGLSDGIPLPPRSAPLLLCSIVVLGPTSYARLVQATVECRDPSGWADVLSCCRAVATNADRMHEMCLTRTHNNAMLCYHRHTGLPLRLFAFPSLALGFLAVILRTKSAPAPASCLSMAPKPSPAPCPPAMSPSIARRLPSP